MEDNLIEFNKQLKETNKKACEDVVAFYKELTDFVGVLDPIKLLSQLTLTFLFVPEGKFIEESSDVVKWARWIEFLSGYLLSHEYPKNTKGSVDGNDLKTIEGILDKYFNAITIYIATSITDNEEEKETESIIHNAKIHSLYVRGEAYSNQLKDITQDIYTQHNEWFIKTLGFTISQALHISKSIANEYNRRVNEEKHISKEHAHSVVNDMIRRGEAKEENREELETKAGCYYYFGNSDLILTFTLDELVKITGYAKEICKRYLGRLSQNSGYRNANYPETYLNAHTAPWDYNTLYERPIILNNDKYIVPIPHLFNEVLFHTFYFDLIADKAYWDSGGGKKYGSWLEYKTAEYFLRIFPKNEVYINPKYPSGNELCDVLVLHDRKVFIIQCKTKKMRYESKIGDSYQTLKGDLIKGVKESFKQAICARDYLVNNKPAKIVLSKCVLLLDTEQITDIFPICVTLDSYQDMITRIANINTVLQLFADNQYPWAISLFDLGVVTELIDYPSMFIHYAKRRLSIERTKFQIKADEIDLLNFYFSQGLYFESEEFIGFDSVGLSGYSNEIDKYMFEKYECKKEISKPKQIMPNNFEEYVIALENLKSSYKTDCLISLLDLGYKGRELFINTVEKVKEKTTNDGKLHSATFILKDNTLGHTFIAMNAGGDIDKLYQQLYGFMVLKKYVTKCKECVGFGWDKNSKNMIDVAVFMSFEWKEDPEVDKMAKEYLKTGEMVSLN